MDRLARAVEATIVRHVEAQAPTALRSLPAVTTPRAGVLRKESDVVPLPGHERPRIASGQGQRGQALRVGPHRLRFGGGSQAHLHVRERPPIGEGGRPDEKVPGVHEGVHADPGRLDPGDDPGPVGSYRHRSVVAVAGDGIDDEDDVASAPGERRLEVDPRLRHLVGLAVDGHRSIADETSGRPALRAFSPVSHSQERRELDPVRGLDRVEPHAQRLLVDRVHRVPGRSARVQDHERAPRSHESGRSRADGERHRLVAGEPLAEDVPDRRRERHVERGPPAHLGLDRQRRARHGGPEIPHRGRDAQHLLPEGPGIEGIGELDLPRCPRRAVAVPSAFPGLDREGTEGVEAPLLGLQCRPWPFGRGRARSHPDRGRHSRGQRLVGSNGQPPVAARSAQHLLNLRFGLDLLGRGGMHRNGMPGGFHGKVPQHGRLVDALVEHGQDHRLKDRGTPLREGLDQGRRRRSERPGDGLREHRARGGMCARRDLGPERGRHGEAPVRLEEQRLRPHPTPLPGGLRGETNRARVHQRLVGRDRHHGLGEGHRQRRSQRHLALGGAPHDREGAVGPRRRPLGILAGREGRLHHRPRARRRQRRFPERKAGRCGFPRRRRQPAEQPSRRRLVQDRRGRDGGTRGRLRSARRLAQAEDETRRLLRVLRTCAIRAPRLGARNRGDARGDERGRQRPTHGSPRTVANVGRRLPSSSRKRQVTRLGNPRSRAERLQ
jgi:hypothetical protein